jgi:hypothetical protein
MDFDGDGEIDYEGFALALSMCPTSRSRRWCSWETASNHTMEIGPNGWIYCGRHRQRRDRVRPENGYAPTTVTTEPATQVLFANDRLYITVSPGIPRHRSTVSSPCTIPITPKGSPIALEGLPGGLAAGPGRLIYLATVHADDRPRCVTREHGVCASTPPTA